MKTAIVDVDNTLYDFSIPWYLEITKHCPQFPDPHRWDRWDLSSFGLMTKEGLMECIYEVHKGQQMRTPYLGADRLLRTLRRYGYQIIIAAHRSESLKVDLEEWLQRHRLVHDQLHVSWDKTELFTPGAVVIDDCPITLKHAMDLKCTAIGLEFPWNRHLGLNVYGSIEAITQLFRILG